MIIRSVSYNRKTGEFEYGQPFNGHHAYPIGYHKEILITDKEFFTHYNSEAELDLFPEEENENCRKELWRSEWCAQDIEEVDSAVGRVVFRLYRIVTCGVLAGNEGDGEAAHDDDCGHLCTGGSMRIHEYGQQKSQNGVEYACGDAVKHEEIAAAGIGQAVQRPYADGWPTECGRHRHDAA